MILLNALRSLKTRSDAEQVDPSIVQFIVSEFTTTQYFYVALLTVLVYHSVITMDKEVRYFWPKPRSTVSIIYFTNRFIGLLAIVSELALQLFTESLESCLFLYWTEGLANLITVLLIDYILLIRVLALYHQDKKLSIVLKVFLGLYAGVSLGLYIYYNLLEGFLVGSLADGMTICGNRRFPPRIMPIISWTMPMTYGLILLGLALYKAAEYWRLSSGLSGFHLVRVLIEDQVLYYGFVIFCCLYVLNAVGSPTLLCVFGGQLLINLKEAGERGANGGTNYTPTNSVSEIDFGENNAVNEQSSEGEGSV